MCKHFLELQENDRYYIDAPGHENCLFCLIADYPDGMTQAEIANFLGLSKMRVCQIEHQAIAKLDRKTKKILRITH